MGTEPRVLMVGGRVGDVTAILESPDCCFGKHYAKTVAECKECVAPVIVEGELFLMNQVCEARTRGSSTPTKLRILSSQMIIERLEKGHSVEQIFKEVLGDSDPEIASKAAWKVLHDRFRYIRTNLDLPVPDLPTAKELKDNV